MRSGHDIKGSNGISSGHVKFRGKVTDQRATGGWTGKTEPDNTAAYTTGPVMGFTNIALSTT
ncbi:hypothetical protein [Amycolatopsis sp. H20-H5]|uniref:hypothetical protein n=1 Tax=Amycolatopsis sp. H20-H5 TaxID=3046309 RepID=UPI002DB7660C|nr:hypothetical protein [Amycolatopsis sp. H20-H5]MEC3979045.1 hypothetical protein [Amycolatopsis sp. H20-H5]